MSNETVNQDLSNPIDLDDLPPSGKIPASNEDVLKRIQEAISNKDKFVKECLFNSPIDIDWLEIEKMIKALTKECQNEENRKKVTEFIQTSGIENAKSSLKFLQGIIKISPSIFSLIISYKSVLEEELAKYSRKQKIEENKSE